MTVSPPTTTDAPPLTGVRVLDLSALGPGPFCSMLLADFGADVVAVERPGAPLSLVPTNDLSRGKRPEIVDLRARGKRSAVVDLRAPRGAEVIARLADHADVLLESNRPGTLERRGLGPDVLCARNPRLIYARLTGWGQNGPYSGRVGHDINYTAVSGTLGAIGGREPVPPLAYVGDLAAGSMLTALGIMMALFERTVTGQGQVIDGAITDGSALLNIYHLAELNAGVWAGRGKHPLSGGAPFYGVYECSDGRYFAVGAIEPQFYAQFLAALGINDIAPATQLDPAGWLALRDRLAAVFASKTRSHWSAVFAEIDGCGTPVLELEELANDPHLRARDTIVRADDGTVTAAPAPRLSRTPGRLRPAAIGQGAHTVAVLGEVGFTPDDIDALLADGTIAAAE